MKFLTKNDFISSFCKANILNLQSLQSMFETDLSTFSRKKEITYLYISKELKICATHLSKKKLKKMSSTHGLKFNQIKLIDGFWYLKSELKD